MNKIVITLGCIVMVAAQWFVPGQMIYEQESVLTQGNPYKFKTQPIDPSDPLRGKYITLRYEMERSTKITDTIWNPNDPIFVYIEEGEDGFAEATAVSQKPLDLDQDYVMARYQYSRKGSINFDLPFDRFYMEESKAYDAELAVRETNRNRDSLAPVCYALVYVKDDVAVLDNVFIGEKSVKEIVEERQN
ncbi:MAG: GDYXXLXY domain-containing protein [Bacteroidota bacterium]